VRLAGSMNAKAVRLGAPGLVAPFELAEIMVESEGLCQYCGVELPPMEGTFDHVVPYARGGANRKDNIVRCCLADNREKGLKSPEELAIYAKLRVKCEVCGKEFRPRWADWKRGLGKTCSRVCSGRLGGSA
jgi:HNH endonuclease